MATVKSMQICGRPLGLRISPIDPNQLFIADAYQGVFEYNIATSNIRRSWCLRLGSIKHLLKTGISITNSVDEPPIRYLNDLDVTNDGKLIISEPSYKFDDHHFHYIVLERAPTGR